jgi:hypothetical protein
MESNMSGTPRRGVPPQSTAGVARSLTDPRVGGGWCAVERVSPAVSWPYSWWHSPWAARPCPRGLELGSRRVIGSTTVSVSQSTLIAARFHAGNASTNRCSFAVPGISRTAADWGTCGPKDARIRVVGGGMRGTRTQLRDRARRRRLRSRARPVHPSVPGRCDGFIPRRRARGASLFARRRARLLSTSRGSGGGQFVPLRRPETLRRRAMGQHPHGSRHGMRLHLRVCPRACPLAPTMCPRHLRPPTSRRGSMATGELVPGTMSGALRGDLFFGLFHPSANEIDGQREDRGGIFLRGDLHQGLEIA